MVNVQFHEEEEKKRLAVVTKTKQSDVKKKTVKFQHKYETTDHHGLPKVPTGVIIQTKLFKSSSTPNKAENKEDETHSGQRSEEETKKAANDRQWALVAQGCRAIPTVQLPTGKSSSGLSQTSTSGVDTVIHQSSTLTLNNTQTRGGTKVNNNGAKAQAISGNNSLYDRNNTSRHTSPAALAASVTGGHTLPGFNPYGNPDSSDNDSDDDFRGSSRRDSSQPPSDWGLPSSNRGTGPPGGAGGGGDGNDSDGSDESTDNNSSSDDNTR